MKKRVGVFGWGIVAPKSPNVAVFRKNLATAESWLTPFEGFGPNNFLVGQPDFDFNDYRGWIDSRFAPRHFQNLKEKMDTPSLYAIGAFIQALDQNPGLDALLHDLGNETHVYIGTGLGAVDTFYESSIALNEAQKRWNAFRALPAHNSVLTAYLASGSWEGDHGGDIPVDPESAPAHHRDEAMAKWNAFWMAVSPELQAYLAEAAGIDGLAVEGDVESGKLTFGGSGADAMLAFRKNGSRLSHRGRYQQISFGTSTILLHPRSRSWRRSLDLCSLQLLRVRRLALLFA